MSSSIVYNCDRCDAEVQSNTLPNNWERLVMQDNTRKNPCEFDLCPKCVTLFWELIQLTDEAFVRRLSEKIEE